MKYTKYNVRRYNKNSSGVLIFFLVIVLAILIGSLVYKVYFKGGNINMTLPTLHNVTEQDTNNQNPNNQPIDSSAENNNQSTDTGNKDPENNSGIIKENSSVEKVDYYVVQCGAFKSENNAETCKQIVSQYGDPFIVNSNDLYKVILGVYNEKGLNLISSELIEDDIEWSKVRYEISRDSLCNSEIIEIINANLLIIDKLNEDNVEMIDTTDLIDWTKTLKQVDEDSLNYSILTNLEQYIYELPSQIGGNKIIDISKNLFDNLNQIAYK